LKADRGVAVIGAGWAGCTAARMLHDRGYPVHLFERSGQVGGHSRSELLNGVVFEPNGPHIFHTSNRRVADFVRQHGMRRSFEHKVITEIFLDDADEEPHFLSWPPQVDELRELPIWPRIEKELAELPVIPSRTNLADYCESIMGPTLYELFVRDYSIKQWGQHPSTLSSSFGPKRLDLRTDGNRRLFRDAWEYYPPHGAQEIIEQIARPVPLTVGSAITLADLEDLSREFSAAVVTAALDEFAGRPGELEWRGIRTVSRYVPLDDPHGTLTPGYQVNRPSLRRPYTRTVETKHATGQVVPATVVTEEYPGAPARHYPVPTVDGRNERRNNELREEIRATSPIPVFFCGRLANYQYIDQEAAIGQGMAAAEEVAGFPLPSR
jgi:UDP-galactopyranose mutase